MSDEWLYAIGLGLVMAAYGDILRFRGASESVNLILQLVFGGGYLIFQIWGFFVFNWWVPIFYMLASVIPIALLQAFIFGGRGLNSIPMGILGLVLCFMAV